MTTATGIGSWPGDGGSTVREALRVVRDVLGEQLAYLPEAPGRGPGADMVGRGAALLEGMPVDLTPSGWRLVDRGGRDLARGQAWLRADLDDLAELMEGFTGSLKVQVAGPWTLSSSIWLPRGERVLSDPGAQRDLTDALAAGVAEHVRSVARLVPGARLTVQVDEPSLPAVLAGRVPTLSGYRRLPPVEGGLAERQLGAVLAAASAEGAATAVHCCAADVPWPVLRGAGAAAVSCDLGLLTPAGWESLAATVEAGTALWAGVTAVGDARTPGAVAQNLLVPWRRVGLEVGRLADVVVTPTCGLVGASTGQARSTHERVVHVAAELATLADA